jgi:hypothetical protein
MFSGRQFLWDNIKWGIIDGGWGWCSVGFYPTFGADRHSPTCAHYTPAEKPASFASLPPFPRLVLSKLSQTEYTVTNTNIRITTATLRNQFTVRLVLRSKRCVLLSTALFYFTSTLCFVPLNLYSSNYLFRPYCTASTLWPVGSSFQNLRMLFGRTLRRIHTLRLTARSKTIQTSDNYL